MLCRELGGPSFSFTAHGIETFDAPEFQALDEKVSRASFTVGVSEFGRSQLCRWSDPAHWGRIHVVRCGVDEQFLGRPPAPIPEARRLVCVARLAPEKGHLPLLHAVGHLRDAGRTFELVLVGEGPMRTALEGLARRLGIDGLVRFTGWQDNAGVIRELLASRALVLPSFSEGLPVVLMEALALGRPCIATQITGVPELVEPGVTGWLVPAGSDRALATRMAEALDAAPAELERMGRAGAARVAALHDAKVEAARLVDLFAGAVRSSRAARRPAALPVPCAEIRHDGPARGALRWAAARVWRASGRIERNRADLYGGGTGLRIAVFHGTPPATLDALRRTVAWWRERWPMAAPADVDDLVAGRWRSADGDRLLVTFDDGLASNYDAAVWLARAGIQAVFFVVPTLLDRTIAQFIRYHEERGVVAVPPVPLGDARGLSTSQVREILSMGHRLAAHNNAHRDLGHVKEPRDLRYEIGEAIERVAELTGAPCRDFAIGFGQPENISADAVRFLEQACPNIYMCYRGLNVPGRTPRFLLRHAHDAGHPVAFTRLCLEGGADHWLLDRIRTMEGRVGLLPASREVAA
jgi:peptidoglycan/xylan/chitin deacetylase (PgdA/CDA1 family)